MNISSVGSPQPHQESKRCLYLDLLRVVAIFGVILLHLSMDTDRWYLPVIYDGLTRWSVPIFVMISRSLFLNPRKELTVSLILRKYVRRLLQAYIFWWLFYCLFKFVRAGMITHSWALADLPLSPQYHLWFLPMLACVYLLIPLLKKIAADRALLRYVLILWLVCLTIDFVTIRDVPQISHLLRLGQVAGYAGYFLLGYFLSSASLTHRQRLVIYSLGIAGALASVAGGSVLYYLRGSAYTRFLANVTPHVVMMSAALFVFFRQHAPRMEHRLAGFVRYVQKDLFGIYLVHLLWIIVLDYSFAWYMRCHVVTLPLLAVAVFVLSLFTVKLLRRVPFLSRVVE